jgi:uncharacterized protein (DUF849 family)
VTLFVGALNGGHHKTRHSRVPVTPAELAADAARVAAVGASEVHVHPRNADGYESLAPRDVAAAVSAIRAAAPGLDVSVTTGAWIEPDPQRRSALIADWNVLPTSASVNAHEDGAVEVARILRARGVDVEVGLFTVTIAEWFVRGPLRGLASRILVEPVDRPSVLALHDATSMLRILRHHDVDLPVLVHSDGDATWPVLRRARSQGVPTRIGFEDAFHLPDGQVAEDNSALVRAALGVENTTDRSG